MQSLAELANKYSMGQPDGEVHAFTVRISSEAKVKLEVMAHHFGVKKCPLAGEILESAINDLLTQVEGDFDEDTERMYAFEMQDLATRS